MEISIHAPAKGATEIPLWCSDTDGNFNPRSREGSDALVNIVTEVAKNFNPRSREGSDTEKFAELQRELISIHAPAKGATGQGRPTSKRR